MEKKICTSSVFKTCFYSALLKPSMIARDCIEALEYFGPRANHGIHHRLIALSRVDHFSLRFNTYLGTTQSEHCGMHSRRYFNRLVYDSVHLMRSICPCVGMRFPFMFNVKFTDTGKS